MAAATPCIARAAMSIQSVGASPQSRLDRPNRARPTEKIVRRPYRSAKRPLSTRVEAKQTEKIVRISDSVASGCSGKLRLIDGKARLTTNKSSELRMLPSPIESRPAG